MKFFFQNQTENTHEFLFWNIIISKFLQSFWFKKWLKEWFSTKLKIRINKYKKPNFDEVNNIFNSKYQPEKYREDFIKKITKKCKKALSNLNNVKIELGLRKSFV